MNIDHLVEFLTTLEPDEAHIFYFSGIHPDPDNPRPRIQAYGSLEEMLPLLIQRNNEGYGIFTCINAITPVYEKRIARRKGSQVTRVRAVFCDWDRPNDKIPAPPIEPSMVVGTSPGKFHMYWLVDDFPLEHFEQAQRGIAKFFGSDASIVDLSREMRLPGFLHTKDLMARTPVRLLAHHPHRRYGADEIMGAFPYKASDKFAVPWDGTVRPTSALTAAVVGAVYPRRTDGAYNIPCPWEGLHTTPSTATSTIYWPPGADNAGKGFFKCLHAHCQERYADHYDEWIAERVKRALG